MTKVNRLGPGASCRKKKRDALGLVKLGSYPLTLRLEEKRCIRAGHEMHPTPDHTHRGTPPDPHWTNHTFTSTNAKKAQNKRQSRLHQA